MIRLIRLFLLRARLRRIHRNVEDYERSITGARHAFDRLLRAEARARAELFAFEHPHLFRHQPTRVYSASASVMPLSLRKVRP